MTIRINDEHWLDNLMGLSLNKKLEQAIHKQARKETLEYLLDRINRGKHTQMRMHETVLMAALHKGKIQDISINKPNDIILDNFGVWLAGLIKTPASGNTSVTLNDIVPSAQTVGIYQQSVCFNATTGNNGTYLQCGSGTTTPARNNTAIETALGTAPENTRFGTGAGSYAVGYVSFVGTVTAGGSGTVNETGLFGSWTNTASTFKVFMLFHDKLGSGVAYVATNSLVTSYSIAL